MRAPNGSLSGTVLVGNRYEQLRVETLEGAYAVVRCDCDVTKRVRKVSLATGATTSCGCALRRKISRSSTRHGHAAGGKLSLTYQSWQSMIKRCETPSASGFEHYGAKGVTVCGRWRTSFEAFLEDMCERPTAEHTLDRFPNNQGNYEPDNCRWATKKEQTLNRRNTVWVTFNGETLCLTDWARRTGIRLLTLRARLIRGWSTERALTAPKGQRK